MFICVVFGFIFSVFVGWKDVVLERLRNRWVMYVFKNNCVVNLVKK